MNRNTQESYVRGLVNAVAETVVDEIKRGKIPEEWDGFELRWYLERAFIMEAATGKRRMIGRRRQFLNHLRTTNTHY